MFRYADLQQHPNVFRSVTGMDLGAFAALLRDFETAEQTRRAASDRTRNGRPRRRAAARPGEAAGPVWRPATGC